ncbi:unnamed protein product [Clonostachys byssicola]|uniref:Aminoglycoside phosphotransferase domain-containing protein n=1 Tax=Clonostachys byssicola TaxID=160290 RepID=A0A9N9Y8R2_9HYPO|nr:unnamed protein product [Clonostachys byssicola]
MTRGDQAYLEGCKDEHMPVPPFDRYIYVLPNYVVKKPLSIGETGYQGYQPDVRTVFQRDENEIEAMKLVQEYTNIPIPRVIHRGEGFNVFERIQGITVNEKSIRDSVNPRQREAIRLQVQGFIQQLAAIPNPTGEVRSLIPSGQIFHLQFHNRGPFKITQDFIEA